MKRGFTLIELLVVIAIIAILAAILFPVFAQAKESAKKSVSVTRAKQMNAAGMLYQQDNDDRFWQLAYQGEAGQTVPDNQGFFRWPWLLHPYAKSFEVFIDAIDSERPDFRDPKSPVYGYAIGLTPSFGYNARYLSPGEEPALPDLDPYVPVAGTSMSAPAETLIFASSIYYEPLSSPKVGYFRVYPPSKWTREKPARGRSWGHVWPRFFGRIVTVCWADGHVSNATVDKLDKESLWQVDKIQ